jgi:putative addiction module component (TIGR02574 family)
MTELENLIRQVLDLPLDQRPALAEKLLESLDELTPEELQQVWAAESERRYEAYRSGKLSARDGEDTHREILDEVR